MRWATALVLSAFVGAAFANDVGQVKVTKGSVHVEREGARIPAVVGMPIRQSDRLVTGADGTVGVTFADNSLLSVGPNSALAVDKFAFDAGTHEGQFDASLQRGTLAVVSGKMVKQSPDAMRIKTPASILGVRGTEFVVKIAEPGT
ncbi:MAG: FecR family protein [Burkholderiales bacterium]